MKARELRNVAELYQLAMDYHLQQAEYACARRILLRERLPARFAMAKALSIARPNEEAFWVVMKSRRQMRLRDSDLEKAREALKPHSMKASSPPRKGVPVITIRVPKKQQSEVQPQSLTAISSGKPSAQNDRESDFGPDWVPRRNPRS